MSSTSEDLVAQREFLLRSLADLEQEREAGDIDERDYETLRDDYTARAAAVLSVMANAGPTEADTVETGPRERNGRRVAVIAGVVAFGIAAGLLLARTAGMRLPGDNITGSTHTSPTVQLDAEAQQLIQQGQILNAIKTFDQVLKLTPADPEALAYKGWLIRLAGSQAHNTQLIDTGLASIRQAEQADPSYPDAHFFAGEILLRDENNPAAAITEFQEYLADNPPQSMLPEVQLELQSAQQMLPGAGK